MRLKVVIIAVVVGLVLVSSGMKRHSKKKQRIMHDQEPEREIRHVELSDRCSWNMGINPETGQHELTDDDVIFVCPKGSSCIWETCNCDNLPDGTIVQNSWDVKSQSDKCKRIFGQKCRSDDDCVFAHPCVKRNCACPPNPNDCYRKKRLVHRAT